MQIRKALPEEADALTNIAQEAKRYWGYPESWIEHWREELTITPDCIAANQVYVAEAEGELLGFYVLISKAEAAELDHLWVRPEQIGQGIGKELFLHAMERARARHSRVEILADPNAEGFYQKMGASRFSESHSEVQGQSRVLPLMEIDPRQS